MGCLERILIYASVSASYCDPQSTNPPHSSSTPPSRSTAFQKFKRLGKKNQHNNGMWTLFRPKNDIQYSFLEYQPWHEKCPGWYNVPYWANATPILPNCRNFFFLNQPNLLNLVGVRHTCKNKGNNYRVLEICGTPTHKMSRIQKEPKPIKIGAANLQKPKNCHRCTAK